MIAVVRQTQSGLQAEMLKQISEGLEQMADMLYSQGVGGNVDIKA